jgi:tetratricopeptide (TPR) repeat protein
MLLVLTLISFPNLAALAGGLGSEKLLWEANQLFREYKDAEALEKYELLLADEPDQQEALTKASIVCGRIGNRFPDDTRKSLYYQKAFGFAQKAMEIDSLSAESNYAMALSLSNLCQTVAIKDRMVQLNQIKTYLDQALIQNSNHAGAWHLMGRWAYKVANLSFAERSANKLLTQLPLPTSTNEMAINAFIKAIELDSSNMLYYYDLARVQREVDLTSDCVSTLQKALDQKLITTEDLELSRRCKVLLQEVLKVRA